MNMKKIKRQLEIEDYIQLKQKATIIELAERFNVNKITIHRDLTDLEKRGNIKKVISGAIGIGRSVLDTSNKFYSRASENWDEKCAISKKALEFVNPNRFYFIDGSSTLLPFVQELSRSYDNPITIITPSIIFQLELSKNQNIKIIGLGGELNKDNSVTAGPYAWRHIEEFNTDKFFFSAGGINENLVLTDLRQNNAMNNKLFLRHSKMKILIVDHVKFEVSSYFSITNIKNVDVVITGKKIKKKYLNKLNKIDSLKVITVDF